MSDLVNGGFESGLTGWTWDGVSGAGWARTVGFPPLYVGVYEGTAFAGFTAKPTNGGLDRALTSDAFAVEPGKVRELTLYRFTNKIAAENVPLRVELDRDNSGSWVELHRYPGAAAINTWERHQISFAPSGTEARIRFVANDLNPAGNSNWRLDALDLRLRPAGRDMLAEPLAIYVAAQGLTSFPGDSGVGFQPDAPGTFTAFFDEAAPALPESDALQVDQSGVQVLVRNSDYAAARTLIYDIHKLIVGFSGELATGFPTVSRIGIAQMPAAIGPDEKGRHEWTAHYIVRHESTGDAVRL